MSGFKRAPGGATSHDRYGKAVTDPPLAPGRSTATARLPPSRASIADAITAELAPRAEEPASAPQAAPVQGKGELDGPDVHAAAAHGLRGSAGKLPFLDQIQRAFGRHEVSGIRAHVGGPAADATAAMNARAYASGGAVAFGAAPDLHTAAHEAAHVVQQRGGVQLAGGVGRTGDAYERHADAVADAVVRGESAEALLDPYAGGAAGGRAVQKQEREGADDAHRGRGAGHPTDISIRSFVRHNDVEHMALMTLLPHAARHTYDQVHITEDFGPIHRVNGLLMDRDLRPSPGVPRTVEEVLQRCYAAEPGQARRFPISANGDFVDYHGGSGLPHGSELWFTPDAFARGIGTWFIQRYYADGHHIATFRIQRIWRLQVDSAQGISVSQGTVAMTKTRA